MKEDSIFRSPLFYVGDKYKLIKEIKSHFPSNIKRFIEPFVGGGSVFLNVEAKEYLLNDINSHVIALHKFLCEQSEKSETFFANVLSIIKKYGLSCSYKQDDIPIILKNQFPKTYFAKYNNDAYMQLREDYNSSERSDPAVLYILLIYGFNRMIRFNNQNDFNIPVGNVDYNENVQTALTNYFRLVKKKRPQWFNMDFRDFLRNLKLEKTDFIYLDPPYLITFSEYNKLWNETVELELLQILDHLNELHIKFAISNVTKYKGKTNELFVTWSKQYNCHSIKSNYINYHDNSIKQFSEVLITNF